MKKIYREALTYILIGLFIWLIISIFSPSKGFEVGKVAYNAFVQSVKIIIAVFFFIGLLQVWLSSETLAKIMGKEAGWLKYVIASTIPIFIGGSLFSIFPLLSVLLEKGASYGAVLAFITAWSGKAPLIPLEIHFLGLHFTILRTVFVIPMALIVGILGELILEAWERRTIKVETAIEKVFEDEIKVEEEVERKVEEEEGE
jgi:uncharacterized membrane protein YraQ (UPF0718 family)